MSIDLWQEKNELSLNNFRQLCRKTFYEFITIMIVSVLAVSKKISEIFRFISVFNFLTLLLFISFAFPLNSANASSDPTARLSKAANDALKEQEVLHNQVKTVLTNLKSNTIFAKKLNRAITNKDKENIIALLRKNGLTKGKIIIKKLSPASNSSKGMFNFCYSGIWVSWCFTIFY